MGTLLSVFLFVVAPQWSSSVLTFHEDNVPIVTLGVGGCFRGPLEIRDRNNKVVFSLEPGVHFPVGCEKE